MKLKTFCIFSSRNASALESLRFAFGLVRHKRLNHLEPNCGRKGFPRDGISLANLANEKEKRNSQDDAAVAAASARKLFACASFDCFIARSRERFTTAKLVASIKRFCFLAINPTPAPARLAKNSDASCTCTNKLFPRKKLLAATRSISSSFRVVNLLISHSAWASKDNQ